MGSDLAARPNDVPVTDRCPSRRPTWVLWAVLVTIATALTAGTASGAEREPRWMTVRSPSSRAADIEAPTSLVPDNAAGALGLALAGTIPATTSSTTSNVDPITIPTVVGPSTEPPVGDPSLASSAAIPAGPFASISVGGADTGASRPIPTASSQTAPAAPAPPWAASVSTTAAGYTSTDLGCAASTSAASLDAFFRERIGPVLGEDYQHVYPLGGERFLWLFQDSFIDQSGAAAQLGQSQFAHNVAMVQNGACFTLLYRGTVARPESFEVGTGESVQTYWFWPMGGELVDGELRVFWAEMHRDADPGPADGLGWHPTQTWLATYSAKSLARLDFQPAPNSGASPIYGYAVSSDDNYTYLFGNTFEQNLDREGGYASGPHSATKMFLARVPRLELDDVPQYWTPDGWTGDPTQAQPISQRYWVENPMQPRFLGGQWVAVTKVDGYWGDQLAVDVAVQPWGPWTTTALSALVPRGGDPLMNTYHAYLMPWLDGKGRLVVSVSENARNMLRDAWSNPARYRPSFFTATLVAPPPDEATTSVDGTSTTTSSTTPDSAPPGFDPTTAPTNPPGPSTTSTITTTLRVPDSTTPTSTSTPSTLTSTSTSTSTPSTSTPSTSTPSTSTSSILIPGSGG